MPACAPGMRPVGRHSETPQCSGPQERSRQRRDRVQSAPFRRGVPVSSQIDLLRARRFMPLFAVQATSAINDNLFKSALSCWSRSARRCIPRSTPACLSAIAGGLLIAPFFLFSALAGELADRYERARLLQHPESRRAGDRAGRRRRAARRQSGAVVCSCCSLLGVQVTFSSPVRYALLPQHLSADELVDGNALLEGGTFLAILFGTIAGGIAVALDRGTEAACLLLVLCAAAGFAASLVRAARPGPVARAASQPQPGHRDRGDPAAGLGAPRRQAVDPRRLVVLAGRRGVPVADPGLREGDAGRRQRRRDAVPRRVLDRGRGRLGAVRPADARRGQRPLRAAGGDRAWRSFRSTSLLPAWRPSRRRAASCSASSRSCRDFTGLRIFVDLTLIAICGGLFIVPLYAIIQQPQRRGGAGAHDRRASTS